MQKSEEERRLWMQKAINSLYITTIRWEEPLAKSYSFKIMPFMWKMMYGPDGKLKEKA